MPLRCLSRSLRGKGGDLSQFATSALSASLRETIQPRGGRDGARPSPNLESLHLPVKSQTLCPHYLPRPHLLELHLLPHTQSTLYTLADVSGYGVGKRESPVSMDVCPEEEAASVHLHGGAFKAGDDLYAFLLVCEQIKNASASGLSHVLSLP